MMTGTILEVAEELCLSTWAVTLWTSWLAWTSTEVFFNAFRGTLSLSSCKQVGWLRPHVRHLCRLLQSLTICPFLRHPKCRTLSNAVFFIFTDEAWCIWLRAGCFKPFTAEIFHVSLCTESLSSLGKPFKLIFQIHEKWGSDGVACYSGFLLHEFCKAFETWIVTWCV